MTILAGIISGFVVGRGLAYLSLTGNINAELVVGTAAIVAYYILLLKGLE